MSQERKSIMNKEKKKVFLELFYNSAGAFIALILMIIGLIAWTNYEYFGYYYEELRFGADFYTEIYDVTQSARNAISNVGDTIMGIYNTIGAIVTFASILMLLYFAKKILSCLLDIIPEKQRANVPNMFPNANAQGGYGYTNPTAQDEPANTNTNAEAACNFGAPGEMPVPEGESAQQTNPEPPVINN